MRRTVLALLFFATPLFAHPSVSIVFDSHGNLYYSDLKQVLRVSPEGRTTVAVPNVHTHELAIDAQDNLYGEHLWYEGERTDRWGHYVWRRSPDGRVTMVIPRTEGFLRNYSFVRDRAGNMYWADRDAGEIRRRAPDGRIVTIARGLRKVRWMTSAPDGTLFLIDLPDLVRVAPDGRVTRLVKNAVGGLPITPQWWLRHDVQGLWLDRSGNIHLAHYADRLVERVDARGNVSVVARSTFPWSPTGGGFAPNGDLWVLEVNPINAVRVRRVGR